MSIIAKIAIGIIGRLVPVKNHDLFLRSLQDVQSTSKKVRAFIIGDGELKSQLKKRCRELKLPFSEEEGERIKSC